MPIVVVVILVDIVECWGKREDRFWYVVGGDSGLVNGGDYE
jgi:hypothetical protein